MKRSYNRSLAALAGYACCAALFVASLLACSEKGDPALPPAPDQPEQPEKPGQPEEPAPPTGDLYEQRLDLVWPEIPARLAADTELVAVENLVYRTCMGEIGGEEVRNYTICFDRTKRGGWWVAYPLVASYTGKEKRPDKWAYDPEIDEKWQASLVDYSYPAKEDDRGHQIPNADRNCNASIQAQTFYCSNSTPQNNKLNGGEWAQLEGRIRSSWMCADTLYVVTGAVWEDDKTTPDREGNECAVPSHYFKVLLRTRRGNVRRAGDRIGEMDPSQLKAIGFWVANADGQGSFKTWTASVAEIERRTGFEFFPTVPAEVKEQHDKADWGL